MGMKSITREFINIGCDILKRTELTPEQEEKLCDELMMLVGRYAPNNNHLLNWSKPTKIEKEDN